MFDMGFLELLVIGIIALIVLGPERLPKAARTVGLWVGKAKQGFDSIKTEIDRELKVKELQQQIEEQKTALQKESGLESLQQQLNQTANTIHSETNSLKEQLNEPFFDSDQTQKADSAGIPTSKITNDTSNSPELKK